MIEIWHNLVGVCPSGYEALEYAFIGMAVLLIISFFFKFIFTLLKILFTFIKK